MDSFGPQHAVLTSDMRGFTRLTREHGIIHFAGLIMQMRRLALHAFARHDPCTCVSEADNCFAVFPDVQRAIKAAVDCGSLIRRFNATVADESFRIQMGGFGIDCGGEVVQDDETRKLFGAPVEWSYRLGESEANHGEVLISVNALTQLAGSPLLAALTLTPRSNSAGRYYYSIDGQTNSGALSLPADDEAAEQLTEGKPWARNHSGQAFERSVLQRYNVSHSKREQIDQQLMTDHLSQGTVVVLGINLAQLGRRHGPTKMIEQTRRIVGLTHPIVRRHSGDAIEEFLFTFDDPLDAFSAAKQMKSALDPLNAETEQDHESTFTGIAAHSGRLLIVPGTDVHWGDPVNTASKLAEDYASEGDLLITEHLYQIVSSHELGREHTFDHQEFAASDVKLKCFRVSS